MNTEKNDTIHMFLCYSRTIIKSWFQYKLDACIRSFTVFIREASGIIVIYLTLQTFKHINGWKPDELLFLFSLIFLSYGILIIFFTGLRDFDRSVHDGGFDRILLRPRGLLFQVISSNADWFAAIGHGGLGITLFLLSASRIGISWNITTVLYYIAALTGGVLIQGAVFLALASLSFYLIKSNNIKEIFYWNMRRFANYPISIFPKLIQYLMIYVMPFAFVNYFPAQFLLRKEDMHSYPQIFMYITPLVGGFLYFLAYLFWKSSLKHYKSTGN